MRRYLLLIPFLFYILPLLAQGPQIQWATDLVEVSSQLSQNENGAKEALGAPNTIYGYSEQSLAWAPNKDQSPNFASIQLGYDQPMRIRQVAVVESLHPGAITEIILYFKNGKSETIYDNRFPRPMSASNRIFSHSFPLTRHPVETVEIRLNPNAVNGIPHIDAIAISDRDLAIKRSDITNSNDQISGQAINLGPMINSTYPEDAPVISPDGKTLYFSRDRHPVNVGALNKKDIWVAYLENDGSWSNAVNLGRPLNNENNNAVVAVSSTNNQLFLVNERLGVAVTKKYGRSWKRPSLLDIDDYYNNQKIAAYHINLDGTILLMALDRKDSYGDLDLYVSLKNKEGSWSAPQNLGEGINTDGQERSVFLAADNKTIYFASNGLEGEGGLDLYMSSRIDDTWTRWTPPVNLGEQINSPLDDHSVTFPASGEYAYFSKETREASFDIFQIRMPESLLPGPVALLKGQVLDATTREPIDATLRVEDLEDAATTQEIFAKKNGEYQTVLPMGENMGLVAEREGYFAVSEAMELTDESLEEEDQDLDTTVQLDGTVTYASLETEQIRLRLQKLDRTLVDLDKQRATKTRAKRSFPFNNKSYQSDPELDALRHKYNLATHKSEDSKSSYKEKNKEKDAELEAMKRKFNKEQNKGKQVQSKGGSSKKDQDLEDMKRRFNQYHDTDGNKKEEEEYLDMEEESDHTFVNKDSYGYDPEFVALQEKVWLSLMGEEEKMVRLGLKKELLNEVEVTILKDLESEMDAASRYRLKKHTVDINRAIKKELRRLNQEKEKREKLSINDSIERALRVKLLPKVQKEIRNDIKAAAKIELLAELEYRFRNDEVVQLRQELERKDRKEIKEEKRQKNKDNWQPKSGKTDHGSTEKPDLSYRELQKNILMIPIKKDQILPMNNIFFESNQSKIKAASNAELRRVLKFLKNNEGLVVEVGGHTNGWCSHAFANELSENRAKAVQQFFVENGIDAKRVQYRGYGKNNPVATNETSTGRKKNQRIELKILSIR